MTDIVHQLARYIAAQLKMLAIWDDVFAVCFVSEDGDIKQVERYKYIDDQNPEPLIVSPTDEMGTYIYIRETEEAVEGSSYRLDDESSCVITGATIKKRFKAVAVSSSICFPVELASRLSVSIQDVGFGSFTRYAVQNVRIDYVSETAGMKTLFEEETGVKPKSDDIEMASFEFDLVFDYETSCADDVLPNLC